MVLNFCLNKIQSAISRVKWLKLIDVSETTSVLIRVFHMWHDRGGP
jgi:hypothetical protein